MLKEYCPVDLQQEKGFDVSLLRRKHLLLIPSQGEEGTKIITGIEGEMLYEQRQEAQAMGDYPGIFISRLFLPRAEEEYRQQLFGNKRPKWLIPTLRKEGVPLDQIILTDSGFIEKIAQSVEAKEKEMKVYGFSETRFMKEIAERFNIAYYGNPGFAAWAGTKVGLQEFAKECGVPTPSTYSLRSVTELLSIAEKLKDAGYEQLVVKVNHSTGGMGHLISSIKELISNAKLGLAHKHLPEEFIEREGGVVQGWIPEAVSVSLATFVDFDGSCVFTGAQAHLTEGQSAIGAVGATPIEEKYFKPILKVGEKIAQGYVRHKAWGPHTMGMLIAPPEVSEKLNLPVGVPLCNDENSRCGATTISKAWILTLREGRFGLGWVVSKIRCRLGRKIDEVIETLSDQKMLITKTGENCHGIFVFNGAVLDSSYEDKFYAIAVSGKHDQMEAVELIKKAKELFSQ